MRHTPAQHSAALHLTAECRNPMPIKLCTDGHHGHHGHHSIKSVLSSQRGSGCVPVAISGCQVAAGGRCSLSHPPLSLASGHDDWRPGARRAEQARSAEGGGGAASVRGVTSQQSGVSRVMIPVRVVITRQMAAPSPAHRRSNIHWLHQRSHIGSHSHKHQMKLSHNDSFKILKLWYWG